MSDEVFTSYSRRDKETVDRIVGELEKSGFSVWIDREDIEAGNQWRVQIVEAIDCCSAFVLMLSPNSAASDNVRREIDLVQDPPRPIFAVMLDPVKLPATIRYQLAGLQIIDVKTLGFDKAVTQLIGTLREHLKKFAPAPEEPKRQMEMVIQGIDISKLDADEQKRVLDLVAQLTDADPSQLKIEKVTAGSVHVFISMPAAAAYRLKTLALNRDRRFKQLGIVALRLAGSKNYVNIASGILTSMATVGPLTALWWKLPALFSSVLGMTGGKLLTIAAALIFVAGIGLAVPRPTAPAVATALPPTAIIPPASTSTPESAPTSTDTPTPVFTATNTPTATLTLTSTSTPTPTYQILTGTISTETALVNCRYGPGEPYLYAAGFELQRNPVMEFYGRMEIQSAGTTATWLYGLAKFYERPCWVNARNIELDGDISNLEPNYYPAKAPLIPFRHPNFPPPTNVTADRQGDWVSIYWTGYTLAPGDQEEYGRRPVYLVEAWTCQGGKIVFTPIGVYEADNESTRVKDEADCSEPSRAQVFVAHKRGYVGPAVVPFWPPYPTPTP